MGARAGRFIFLATSTLLLAGSQVATAQDDGRIQGWTAEQQSWWYSVNQGSRLMPLTWMRALEQAENERPFLAPGHIAGFGYIAEGVGGGGLPLGFAIDDRGDEHLVRTQLRWYAGQRDREPWVGLTCAACHTNEIVRNGQRRRIYGAPGMGDFQRLVEAVDRALVATRDDAAKWDRFARAVLGAADTPSNRQSLRGALDRLIADQAQLARMNGNPIRYGFARLDAFGHIFNKTVALNGSSDPDGNPSNAPVSYPFLWNVPQHDLVQWNGSVANTNVQLGRGREGRLDFGAVGRNAGEVIGVFGDVVVRPPRRQGASIQLFRSSINANNLIVLEDLLGNLLPPAWPEPMLGRIDRDRAARGALLFEAQCADCHHPLGRHDLTTPIRAEMSWFAFDAPPPSPGRANIPPGTDPLMACNAFSATAESGRLQGYRVGDHVIGEDDRVINQLTVTVKSSLVGKWKQLLRAALTIFLGGRPDPVGLPPPPPPPGEVEREPSGLVYPGLPERYRRCVDRGWRGPNDRILGYKARPLTGIWATGPFLHNGSVPTLYDLLLPPAQRPARFWVGTREFDPERVGFRTGPSPENSFRFETRDPQGNVLWGNFNGGHDYNNAALSHEQRLDLVEYMKTL